MRPEEQHAVFQFYGALVSAHLADPDSPCYRGNLQEWFDFLALFDAPVGPLLEQWSQNDNPFTRGRFAVLLADRALALDARFQVDTGYLDRVLYLSENREAVARFIAPEFV